MPTIDPVASPVITNHSRFPIRDAWARAGYALRDIRPLPAASSDERLDCIPGDENGVRFG